MVTLHDDNTHPAQTRPRRSIKIAIGMVVAGGILATSGVAHAGYRWSLVPPKTGAKPSMTTTSTSTTTTTAPTVEKSYRWR